jgi:hypothetical protein
LATVRMERAMPGRIAKVLKGLCEKVLLM